MFNAEKPSLEDLPTSAQLKKSTLIAAASALAILVTVVLPSEYAIDPTGVGRVLGLTEMGEIKAQLADEAEADRVTAEGDQSSLLNDIFGLFVGAAYAQEAEIWRDQTSFTLAPGETNEWKFVMEQGNQVEYLMIVEGGRVNFDLHGHGGGQSETYEKGRGSIGSEGSFTASSDGAHGWFWRNRDKSDVTVTVQARGDYSAVAE